MAGKRPGRSIMKVSGRSLNPIIFGDTVVKRNTWYGTRYAKAMFTLLNRPIPPWSRERYGPGVLANEEWQKAHGVDWMNIHRVNEVFKYAAKLTGKRAPKNIFETIHAAGYRGKKFLEARATIIGQTVKKWRWEGKSGEDAFSEAIADLGIVVGAPTVRAGVGGALPTPPAVSPHEIPEIPEIPEPQIRPVPRL